MTLETPPNQPDAVNPAITSQLHSEDQWRGVTDPERWYGWEIVNGQKHFLLRFFSEV